MKSECFYLFLKNKLVYIVYWVTFFKTQVGDVTYNTYEVT